MTLKRSAFKRPERIKASRPPITPSPEAGRAKMSVVDHSLAIRGVPKGEYIRSKPYREAVAKLSCFRCGVADFSNAAHSDSDGKGAHIKSCDTTCYPLCVDRPGVRGCHSLVGASGTLGKEARRELETQGAESTRTRLILASQEPGKEAARLRTILRDIGLVR